MLSRRTPDATDHVRRPAGWSCGEKRTARTRAALGTENATQPERTAPVVMYLSKSSSGVLHTPPGTNTGVTGPRETSSEKSPVAELSYRDGPELTSSTTIPDRARAGQQRGARIA